MSHYQGKLITTGRHLFDDGGRVVATVVSGEGYNLMDNNRRLVACWNACDGLPTDLLEQMVNPTSTYTALLKERNDLVKERDELVATLRLASRAMEHMGDALNDMDVIEEADIDICDPAFDAVRDTLTKYPEAS